MLRQTTRVLLIVLALCWASLAFAVTYPDMTASTMLKPNPEPTLPVAMDTFAPPVDISTPAANTPTFGEWTRTGGPDDTLVATGDRFSTNAASDLGKDTLFMVYGQSTATDGRLKPGKIQRMDAQKAAITLDYGLPSWCMYLVWARNANGYGRPVAVNRTEAWWLGPDMATRGQTISVYGRNLSHNNDTMASWVYVKPANGAGQWATVKAVNPYKVDFVVPNSLANGTYEVWVHNGHGRSYGWSGPLTLTVNDGIQWTGQTFNVKDYGAMGDGTTDDEATIQAALDAAKAVPYSTIYFPAGTYMVSKGFVLTSNTRWQGAGATSTCIKVNAGFVTPSQWDGRRYSLIHNENDGLSNVELRDMTFDANNNLNGYIPELVYLRGVNNCRLTNMTLKAKNYTPLDLNSSNYVFIANCNLTGIQTFLGAGRQLFISGSNYYNTNDAESEWMEWGRTETSVTQCTGQDEDTSLTDGWGMGRFFTGNGIWGTSRNTYLGGNTTFNLAVRPDYPDQNCGEQCMWEGNNTLFRGTPTSATTTTVTLPGLPAGITGQEAVIVSGKGLGQHRKIIAAGNGTITVDPAWNVIPDATSSLLIEYAVTDVAIYHNTFGGKNYAATTTNHIASAGVEPYGGCYDFVVDNNTINQVRYGFSIWGLGQDASVGSVDIHPTYWQLFVNNKLQKNRVAVNDLIGFYSNPGVNPGPALLGVVIRHNTITNPVLNAFVFSNLYWYSAGTPMDMSIIEHNTGLNLPVAIDCSDPNLPGMVSNTLFYKNYLSRGTSALSNSLGINFAANQNPALRENTFTGFAAAYGGALPGPILELPLRDIRLSGASQGYPVTITLPIWNSGTGPLSWTATPSTANWLALSATNGTIANENSAANITLTCNPAMLAKGLYTTEFTVTSGTQTKKVAVEFTVDAVTMQDLSQSTMQPSIVTYKTINGTPLTFQRFSPPARKPGVLTPAVIFIHGGGWSGGDVSNYAMHCRYLALRGDVVFNINYRLVNIGSNTMFDALYDCNSASRFIRAHAADYGIDPNKIAVFGESAGGHLVAAMGTLTGMNEPGEDTTVSSVPNLELILNPITDLTATPWFVSQFYQGINTDVTTGPGVGLTADQKRYMLSPLNFVAPGQPPMILLHGTADPVVDIAQSDAFAAAEASAGNVCAYHRLQRYSHAFIYPDIPGCGNEASFVTGMRLVDAFLTCNGYLDGSPTLIMGTTTSNTPK